MPNFMFRSMFSLDNLTLFCKQISMYFQVSVGSQHVKQFNSNIALADPAVRHLGTLMSHGSGAHEKFLIEIIFRSA